MAINWLVFYTTGQFTTTLVSALQHWLLYYNTGYFITTLVILLQHWLKYSEIKLNGIHLIKLRIGS